jgi:hypothetical protein
MKETDKMAKSIEDRFWKKVKKGSPNECWEWSGSKNGDGYGRFSYGKITQYAHRVVWILKYNKIPKNIQVLHHCNNPSCVNPIHLFLGTQKDNMNDRDKKGRTPHTRLFGSKNGKSKLIEEQVITIRILHKIGFSLIELSRIYKVNVTTIEDITNRHSWNHI